jgi:hypothetical protein
MGSRVLRGMLFLIIAMTLAAICFAQSTSTARIDGAVQDATGAVVPNAKIIITNVNTRRTAETTSNATGAFALAALQPGKYIMTVEASGFRKTVVNNIELDVDDYVSQKVTLEIGQVTESVEVLADTIAVQTTDSQVSRTITLRDIDTLPQLARTPLTLAIFQPGVQIAQNGSSAGVDNSFSRINGQRQGSNNNTLDGIDANDAVAPRLGLSLTANNTDSVGEFRVITEGSKAEYGRNAGGQIELITRSGTNQYHGNLFDYLRNSDLNANDFFNNASGQARPVFIQNIYGGSFGGPIKHNKLFVFGNFQGRRTTQTKVQNRTVPTDLAKSGIFQYHPTNAASTIAQVNILNLDPRHLGIDPFIANLLKIYPSPNNFDTGDGLNTGGFRFNNPNGSFEDQLTIKADYNMTEKMHFFVRESWERNSSIDSLNNADAQFPGEAQGTQGGHRWGVATGYDWTISSTLVNEFRYGHQSAVSAFFRPERVAGLQINAINDAWTLPANAGFAQGRNSPVNEFTDNITKIHGSHTFKAGANMRFTKQFGYNDAGIYPNVSLAVTNGNVPPAALNPANISSTDLALFQGLYNNLLGRVSIINQTFLSNLSTYQAPGTTSTRNYIFHEYGYFIQDDWKVRRNLTFNIGLRYEFSGVPYETNGQQGQLANSQAINLAANLDGLTIQKTSQWYNNDWNNFAPRFGFAWDPRGDGKMALRGSYGIYYDRIIGAATSLVDGNTPGFFVNPLIPDTPNAAAGSDVRISDKPGLPVPPPSPTLTLPDTRSASIVVFNPKLSTGYVHQYTLTFQRELAHNTVLEAGYLGNRGVKLFTDTDLNQPRIYGDFLNSVNQITSAINSNTLASVPASNTLVRIFGSAQGAVSALGQTTFTQGLAGTLANNLDGVAANFNKYAAAGVSNFYLRNFPQFNQVIYGSNDGRSYYDSLQVSVRRTAGALRMSANYTYSKSMDNVTAEGNGFTNPIDNFNLGLNRARADFDRPHVFSSSGIYTLPIGKGHRWGGDMPRWVDAIVGGWDFGALMIWESGSPFTITSGRVTGPNPNINTWINYGGDRNIGSVVRPGNGVFLFTADQIATLTAPANLPVAGSIGTSGRNTFRGPRYFNIDASLVKKFKLTERQSVSFRAEAYNLVNNVNFANPAAAGLSIATPLSFGKISATAANPRFMQGALRYDF